MKWGDNEHFFKIAGEITEKTFAGVCSTLVIVPIVAVSIAMCCCYAKNMITVCLYHLNLSLCFISRVVGNQ